MAVRPDLRWFIVGMGVKRWVLALLVGIAMISLGIGYLLVTIYRQAPLPEVFYWLTLQFIDRWIRGVLFISAGVALTAFAIIRLNRSLLQPFLATTGDERLVDILYREKALRNAPVIVCIGGGPGLSIALRGLKNVTANLWGITLGRGPARTRSELGLLRDRVLRASNDEVIVTATTRDGAHLESETAILQRTSGEPIAHVSVQRVGGGVPEANPDALEVIEKAEVIVIGPGDLFASVIPPLLVPDIAEAVRRSSAKTIFVCNIMTQAGKTNGFTVADHVRAIHSLAKIQIDYILVNKRPPNDKLLAAYREKKQSQVVFDPNVAMLSRVTFANTADKFTLIEGAFLIEADLMTDMREELFIDREGRDVHKSLTVIRHDPDKLGAAVSELLNSEAWRLAAAR
ncbi:MAG: 2-phospho-L-lactate transferase CofD family protein [Chloroflexota bacterium]|nr:2-phospho-L-lactate transferase CofD family protein [Dehalococcoidia bacterium]MDW8252276.1 2-phospho-L-lactate transferase CofD family protein [Chloroflexota bacterium]